MDAKSRTWVSGRMLAGLLGATVMLTLVGCETPNPILRRQGLDAMAMNRIDRADNRFAKAVKQDETDWRATFYLSQVRLKESRWLDAQLLAEKALTLRPWEDETEDMLDVLAEAIFQQNQPANVAAMVRKASDDHGTTRDYLREAKYLGKIGDVDGAKLAYHKAIKMAAKDDPQPFIAMADYLESVGDTQGALKALRMAFYIAPGSFSLAERFRQYGIVPGPTVALEPVR